MLTECQAWSHAYASELQSWLSRIPLQGRDDSVIQSGMSNAEALSSTTHEGLLMETHFTTLFLSFFFLVGPMGFILFFFFFEYVKKPKPWKGTCVQSSSVLKFYQSLPGIMIFWCTVELVPCIINSGPNPIFRTVLVWRVHLCLDL